MPCPVSGKRHSWERRGLDVTPDGRLVRIRVCSYCQRRRVVPYHNRQDR